MGLKVLIVDDSSVMRKIIMRSLRHAEIELDEISEAADGYEGLHQLSSKDVDIVFSDINMPNMDGLEFIQKIREMNGRRQPHIVMLTTEGVNTVIVEALARGANTYIVKPFTPEMIRQALSPLLAAK